MAKLSGKSANIMVDDSAGTQRDISSDVISYTLPDSVDKLEVTGFGEGSHNFIAGLPVWEITLDVIYNTSSTSGAFVVLQGIMGASSSKTVTIKPEGSGTGKTLAGEFMLESITPQAAVNGDIKMGTAKFAVMGGTAPTWT